VAPGVNLTDQVREALGIQPRTKKVAWMGGGGLEDRSLEERFAGGEEGAILGGWRIASLEERPFGTLRSVTPRRDLRLLENSYLLSPHF